MIEKLMNQYKNMYAYMTSNTNLNMNLSTAILTNKNLNDVCSYSRKLIFCIRTTGVNLVVIITFMLFASVILILIIGSYVAQFG